VVAVYMGVGISPKAGDGVKDGSKEDRESRSRDPPKPASALERWAPHQMPTARSVEPRASRTNAGRPAPLTNEETALDAFKDQKT